MLYFTCAVCGKKLACDEEQGGETISCPDCAAQLTAPLEPPSADGRLPEAIEAPMHGRTDWAADSEDMDMTPMVDVTFLLLIFFMITASYSLQKTFELPRSESQQAAKQPQTLREIEDDADFIVVRVDQYNTFFVSAAATDDAEEREVTDRQSLLVELRRVRDSAPGSPPSKLVVVAHGDARHEQVVQAMDAGSAVGMQDVMLVTTEDDDS
ncbi:MAG: biopolymer transporter ExbD [Pirellulales bacterium]